MISPVMTVLSYFPPQLPRYHGVTYQSSVTHRLKSSPRSSNFFVHIPARTGQETEEPYLPAQPAKRTDLPLFLHIFYHMNPVKSRSLRSLTYFRSGRSHQHEFFYMAAKTAGKFLKFPLPCRSLRRSARYREKTRTARIAASGFVPLESFTKYTPFFLPAALQPVT